MGLASLQIDIGNSCDFVYSVLQLNAILGLDSLGLALSRPQIALNIDDFTANLKPTGPTGPGRIAFTPALVQSMQSRLEWPWAVRSFSRPSLYFICRNTNEI